MANFAVIENNKVINIIIADTLADAEAVTGSTCIDYTNGWDYENGIDGDVFFPAPVVEETPAE